MISTRHNFLTEMGGGHINAFNYANIDAGDRCPEKFNIDSPEGSPSKLMQDDEAVQGLRVCYQIPNGSVSGGFAHSQLQLYRRDNRTEHPVVSYLRGLTSYTFGRQNCYTYLVCVHTLKICFTQMLICSGNSRTSKKCYVHNWFFFD